MRKPRLRPPANDTRPTRRSLVELTAAASRAADDSVLLMPVFPIAAATADAPQAEEVANTSASAAASTQPKAPGGAKPANERLPRAAVSADTESTAEMLADIAKDHQARALDGIKLGLAAMLDYAKDRTKTPTPADGGSPDGSAKPDEHLSATMGAAAEYRAEAMEIVKAQAATTADYARELTDAKTVAEFVEASSALARKQCEFMVKQASVLQSFARRVTKSGGRQAPDDRDGAT